MIYDVILIQNYWIIQNYVVFFRNLERNLEDNNGMTELDVIKI